MKKQQIKSLTEALQKIGYDVTTEKSEYGNALKGNLALDGIHLDFTKPVHELTDEEIYQIGRTVVLEKKGKGIPLSKTQIIEEMKSLLKIN